MLFSHEIIRPEKFDFRNKEEWIGLFAFICEIFQIGKFNDQFIFLALFDLKKKKKKKSLWFRSNLLSTYTKLSNNSIRGKCLWSIPYFKSLILLRWIVK